MNNDMWQSVSASSPHITVQMGAFAMDKIKNHKNQNNCQLLANSDIDWKLQFILPELIDSRLCFNQTK